MKQIDRNNRLAEGTSKPFCEEWIAIAKSKPKPLYFNNILIGNFLILSQHIC
ncbi:MAG: hypothetical protein QXT49_05315 [Candidatus Nezhaarchaeales archaeon]